MMKFVINKILCWFAVAMVVVLLSVPMKGQMLDSRKPGTVLEQLQQSSLYNHYDADVLAATDYVNVYNSVCFWKDGVKGCHESPDSASILIQKMLDFAVSFMGTHYCRGAVGPKAFDCSGFTSYVFGQFGYALNRTSRQQINDGEKVEQDELRPGDLVFFNGRAVNRNIGHVGIVTEVDSSGVGFSFIHASSSQGVCVSKYPDEEYYQKRYIGACRPIQN